MIQSFKMIFFQTQASESSREKTDSPVLSSITEGECKFNDFLGFLFCFMDFVCLVFFC